ATDAETLAQLGAVAARAGARLVSCEPYADYLGAKRPKPAAVVVPGAVSLGSVTKAFGLGSLRIGWVLCRDAELLRKIAIHFDHVDANCATPSLRAAAACLDRMPKFEARATEIARAGYAPFRAWALKETERGRVRFAEPAGAIIAFPKLERVADTIAFAK